MEYLTLEIGDYELDVIPLHEMPGLKVLRLLNTQPDMKRLKASVDMIRLALRDPRDWDNKIQFFTMGQLMKLVDDWMAESQELANRQAEEDSMESYAAEDDDEDFELTINLDLPEEELDPNELFELFMSQFESDDDEEDEE
jgi:hypothetical protein